MTERRVDQGPHSARNTLYDVIIAPFRTFTSKNVSISLCDRPFAGLRSTSPEFLKKEMFVYLCIWQGNSFVFARLNVAGVLHAREQASRACKLTLAKFCQHPHAALASHTMSFRLPVWRTSCWVPSPGCQSEKHSLCSAFACNWLHFATMYVCACTWGLGFFSPYIHVAITYKSGWQSA